MLCMASRFFICSSNFRSTSVELDIFTKTALPIANMAIIGYQLDRVQIFDHFVAQHRLQAQAQWCSTFEGQGPPQGQERKLWGGPCLVFLRRWNLWLVDGFFGRGDDVVSHEHPAQM